MSVRLSVQQAAFFREHRSDLVGLIARDKSRVVCLVEASWHKSLYNWLNGLTNQTPSILNNRVLFKNDKLNTKLKFKENFQVIEKSMWEPICEAFGSNPKATRYFVLNPATKKPTVILEPINLSIIIEETGRQIKKVAAPTWMFGPLLKQLCSAIGLQCEQYKLVVPDGKKRLKDDTSVKHVSKKYPGTLILKRIKSNCSAKNSDSESSKEDNNKQIDYILSKHLTSGASVSYPLPIGFENLGNSCYFNAALQCIIRVPKLTNFMLSNSFDLQLNKTNPRGSGGRIANAYRNLLRDVCNKGPVARDPTMLIRAISQKYSQFANSHQHDAQELLGSLIDGLHEDLNARLSPKNGDNWVLDITRNESPVNKIFHGSLRSSIYCPECHSNDSRIEPFCFLSLDVPARGHQTLEGLLDLFSRPETLDRNNLYKCEHCHRMVQARKSLNVEKCGDVLMVHFKRFESAYGVKVRTPVEYPDVLDMSKFTAGGRLGNYKLTGGVFHSGGLDSGHYTAAALDHVQQKWYTFDDSYVEEISPSGAHSSNAYILFYQKEQ